MQKNTRHELLALVLVVGLVLLGVGILYLVVQSLFPDQTQDMPGFSTIMVAVGGAISAGAFLLQRKRPA